MDPQDKSGLIRQTFVQHPSSAMDIAVLDMAVVRADSTCSAAADQIADDGSNPATWACVLDDAERLIGTASLRQCLQSKPDTVVAEIMSKQVAHVDPSWSAEAAARRMMDDDLAILPVLDAQRRVKGVITAQRAYRHLLGKAEDDGNDLVGVVATAVDDYGNMSVWTDFMRRAPWVLVLAVAGLAAGYVVHVYEDALDALVILALYMPMVADTGGNVGTQAASLVTRAISSGHIQVRNASLVMWREMRVSLMLAAALFLFAYLKVWLISNPADVPLGLTLSEIAFAIGVALAVQVVSATLIGAVLPLGAVAARLDPAVVSGPALTTIVDLTGLIFYFSITTHLLRLAG